MKRKIIFGDNSNTVAEALVTCERCDEFDRVVGEMIEANYSIEQIVNAMNDRGDLTDNEWTSFMFSLGYCCAKAEA